MLRTLAEQIEAVRAELSAVPEGLQAHVGRVAVEAMDLARRWNLDPERAELAVWGHDLFRALPEAEQIALAERSGVRVRRADRLAPIVLHGPSAAAILEERYGVTDREVLDAIAQHTLGAGRMSLLSKVLLIADKVETRKRDRDPAMQAIRKVARRDLDLALLCWADWKWVEERRHGWASHPAHWKARRAWVRAHHEEIGAGLR